MFMSALQLDENFAKKINWQIKSQDKFANVIELEYVMLDKDSFEEISFENNE